jgi:hypothetical protein
MSIFYEKNPYFIDIPIKETSVNTEFVIIIEYSRHIYPTITQITPPRHIISGPRG